MILVLHPKHYKYLYDYISECLFLSNYNVSCSISVKQKPRALKKDAVSCNGKPKIEPEALLMCSEFL